MKTFTEEEAHYKYCPSLEKIETCRASRCMAWQWEDEFVGWEKVSTSPSFLYSPPDKPIYKQSNRGYCGLIRS